MLSETRQLCDNAVKPLVDRVAAVKTYGADKVSIMIIIVSDLHKLKAFSPYCLFTLCNS